MFKAEDLAAWLEQNGAPEATYFSHHTPMSPDLAVTITPVTGPYSSQAEEAIEKASFQIRARSGRNEAGTDRDLLAEIDPILLDHTLYPYTNDSGKHVFSCRRLGGPPVFLRIDQQHRSEFVCNYYITVER